MLRWERRTVQLVREDASGVPGRVERQAPLVALLDLALDAAVETREDDLDGPLRRDGRVEQGREGDAAPEPRADRLRQPRLADRPRLEQRPTVPRALHRDGELDRRQAAQVVEPERRRLVDGAADLELPGDRVDERDVVVDEQVVEPHRRDRPAERLQRHRVVARGKP